MSLISFSPQWLGILGDDETELWVVMGNNMCQWSVSLYMSFGWLGDDESEVMGRNGLQNVLLSIFSLHWHCLVG